MSDTVHVQWFPGHMTKTKRKIQENLKLVDIVAEVIDSRVPVSSRNPDLDKLVQNKPRIIIMNKSDISDPQENMKWEAYYKSFGFHLIQLDCKSGKGINKFLPMVKQALKEKIVRWESKGMTGRSIRIMIVGIPNVGKSSLINKLTSNSKIKIADRPGVTRGNQWFSIEKGFDLLDTPGVLWPKFEDKNVGEKLAFIGSIKDQVIDIEHLAIRFLEFIQLDYSKNLIDRYHLDGDVINMDSYDLLAMIARKRGMLMSGGKVDLERASIMILDEFRGAKLGRITLEKCD